MGQSNPNSKEAIAADPSAKEVKQNLWLEAPQCACCNSGERQCTADKPCEHCSTFFDYILDMVSKTTNNMRPLIALKNGNGDIDGEWYVMYWSDEDQVWHRARYADIVAEVSAALTEKLSRNQGGHSE